ncbi:dUTP diphosphatase [Peptoniphilus equinus]|uniref:Deoxyuridine 5'-triphosphate nucleotidohydrolase n=1 Tax=Peptoniphilus equinus TaxID=3016343 RepID=A0ABY7QWN3_9FIRM|nr:dUTP diphosphatase [Peptoniphilus equinus]WBW50685.1 dUTP diphosphatase [Peptoniphilus equinus]
MKVKLINRSDNPDPQYKTVGSAGMDVCAFIDSPYILNPFERYAVPTGLYFEIPEGFEIQVRARSGLALKHGISLPNGIGTIDSDYRGELKILLVNLSNEPFTIHSGDRIGQIVLAQVEHITFEKTESLSETSRSDGGFGHTGLS